MARWSPSTRVEVEIGGIAEEGAVEIADEQAVAHARDAERARDGHTGRSPRAKRAAQSGLQKCSASPPLSRLTARERNT